MSWKSIVIVLPIFSCLAIASQSSSSKLTTKYEWKYIDYTWENCAKRNAAIKAGYYDPEQSIIIDTDVAEDGRVFVTVIRRPGVPSTLNTISNEVDEGGPLLSPYPNWNWTIIDSKCDTIVNVYRILIDKCDRLWVMDNGRINGQKICSPKILVFELKTDELVGKLDVPDNVAFDAITGKGLLVTPMVEYTEPYCQNVRVYIADVQGNALVVYNGFTFRRIESEVFGPKAEATRAEIAGETFDLPDGVLGMALSPIPSDPEKSRILVSRPFASYDMVVTETNDLIKSFDGTRPSHIVYSGVLPSQAVAMAFSSEGVLFFGLTNETALACWNMNQPMKTQNIVLVDRNPITHQFVSGLKVIKASVTNGPESLWMVSNRYQKIARGNQKFDEINFRIMTGSVADLIDGTKCAKRGKLQ